MKRILALVLVLAMICAIALTIVSCGVEATCLTCGEKFNGNEDELVKIGDEYTGICPDCKKLAEDIIG